MFGKYFDTSNVDKFADWVVEEVKRTLPATFDNTLTDVQKKVERLDKRIGEQASTFGKESKLNLYKKARLASRVQEGMSSHGYPQAFIRTFSLEVVRRVTVAARAG